MLSNLFTPPPYARRMSACSPWPLHVPEPCAEGVHRFNHASRTCRCGGQTVPEPEARGARRHVSRRKRPYSGFNAMGTSET